MVSRSARAMLYKLKKDLTFDLSYPLKPIGWQTWSYQEVASFVVQHPLIHQEAKDIARDLVYNAWTKF